MGICSSKTKKTPETYVSTEESERLYARLKTFIWKEISQTDDGSMLANLPSEIPKEPKPLAINQRVERYKGTNHCFSNNEKIIEPEKDLRNPFKDTHKWPNSAIGLLEMEFEHVKYMATGVMIGPLIVLTAAHNIYDKPSQKQASRIEFIPGKNGDNCPFGRHEAEKWYFPDEYKTNSDEDYAIIFLKPDNSGHPLGDYTGIFGLRSIIEQKDLQKIISIKGYPGEKAENEGHKLYGMSGVNFKLVKPSGVISHQIITSKGQSGSSLLLEEELVIIGVHVRGNQDSNEATAITQKRLEQINSWIKIHSRPPVEILSKLSFANKDFSKEMKVLNKFSFDNLKILELDNNKIGPEGAKLLGDNQFPQLKKLVLRGNNIGHQGVKILTSSIFTNLIELDLYNNNIGDRGVNELGMGRFSKLDWLNLGSNQIGDKGVVFLSNRVFQFQELKTLLIEENKISEPIMESLKKAFKGVEIL